MKLVPATVTISIKDRPAPAGPSIAVSITPDPSSTPKDSYSPAVALWVLIRAHIQAIQAKKEHHAPRKEVQVKPQAPRRDQGRKPHRASPRR